MVYTINGEQLTRRELVTIDGSQVTTQTGIPLMLNIDLPNVATDGKDVRLAKLDGTPIAREIECVDVPNTDSVTIHYPFNTVASTDSQFYVYWGNASLSEPAADSTYGSEAVWDSSVENAYLMVDEIDSSGNGRTLTKTGAVTYPNDDYGKTARADWTNSNKLTGTNIAVSPSSDNYQIVIRFKKNGAPSVDYDPVIVEVYGDGSNKFRAGIEPSTGTAQLLTRGAGDYSTHDTGVNVCDNVWHTLIYRRSSTEHGVVIDGTKNVDTLAVRTLDSGATDIKVGISDNPSYDYINQADIGMIIIESTARSDNYESTRHNNLNNPTATGTDPFYKSISTPQHQRRTPQFIN